MSRGAVLRALLIGILLVAIGAVFGTAVPAQAAPKPIGLSTDGVTFTDSMSTSLFAGVTLVPGQQLTRSFWVKNQAMETGNFAVAVQDVASGDPAFLGALSLQLTAGTTTGPAVLFSSVAPCRSLASAISFAPGAVVRMDVTLALSAALQSAQSSVGAFKLPVTMTSTDVAPPDGCAPSTPGGTGGGGGTVSHPHVKPGTIDTATITGAGDGTVEAEVDPLPDSSGTGYVYATGIVPNTGRFYQEFDVLGWLALLALSGIVAWWRSRRDPEETYR